MKKVKVWWPSKNVRSVAQGKRSNGSVLMVRSLEDLLTRLQGWNYKITDTNVPEGFDWVVKDMTKDSSCNC